MEINNKVTLKTNGKSPDPTYVHQISENWKILLSEGCFIVRERAHAGWLFDLILSYQSSTILFGVKYQEWFVKRLSTKDVQVLCRNADKEIMIAKVLNIERFPLSEVTILVQERMASLKSEN
jgi:hypothetical protein